ncbi:MAG: hypothetical protein ABIG89_01820 [Candidatus Woesearchaeota archaeon]
MAKKKNIKAKSKFNSKYDQKHVRLFIYATVLLFILIIILTFVKFSEDLFGKAVQKTLDDQNKLSSLNPDGEYTFAFDGVNYLLNVGKYDASSNKLPVLLEKCAGDNCNVPTPVEICNDEIDNDFDAQVDCDDEDCFKTDLCMKTSDKKVLFKLPGYASDVANYPLTLTITSGGDACKKYYGSEYTCKNLEIYSEGVWKGTTTPGCSANKQSFEYSGLTNALRAVCQTNSVDEFCKVNTNIDGTKSTFIPIASSGSPSDFTCYDPNSGTKGCVDNDFERCLYMERMLLGGDWEKTPTGCGYLLTDIKGNIAFRAVCGDLEKDCSNTDDDGIGIDDNEDGKANCDDVDCINTDACAETLCTDGIDNNNNGWFDCSDASCFKKEKCDAAPVDTSGDVLFAMNTIKANTGDIIEIPVFLEKKSNIKDIRHIEFSVVFDSNKIISDINDDNKPDYVKKFTWMTEGVDSGYAYAGDLVDNPVIKSYIEDNEANIRTLDLKNKLSQEDLLVEFDKNNIKVKIDKPLGESIFYPTETLKEIIRLKFEVISNEDEVVSIDFVEDDSRTIAEFSTYSLYYNSETQTYENLGLIHEAWVGHKNNGAVIAVANFEVCNDVALTDEDFDKKINCADTDCIGQTGVYGQICEATEITCDDTFDNDDDNLVDCSDIDDCSCTQPVTGLTATGLRGVDIISNADQTTDIVVVGLNGKVHQYKNSGWSPVDVGLTSNLFDTWITSTGELYIFGSSGTLVRVNADATADASATVDEIPTRTTNTLNSVVKVDDNTAYLVSSGGELLKYDNTQTSEVQYHSGMKTIKGAIVTATPNYPSLNFKDIWTPDGGTTLYIVAYDGHVKKYTDGTFTDVTVEICEEQTSCGHGSDACDVVTVCESNIFSQGHNSDFNFEGIWGTSKNDYYIVGKYSKAGGNAVVLHYDGTKWAVVYEKKIDTGSKSLYSIWGSSLNNIYSAGYGGTIIHYDGTSWSDIESSTTNNLYEVKGTADKVYIVGESSLLEFLVPTS